MVKAKIKINEMAVTLSSIILMFLLLILVLNIYFTIGYLFSMFINELSNYSTTGFFEVNVSWKSWFTVWWNTLRNLLISLFY